MAYEKGEKKLMDELRRLAHDWPPRKQSIVNSRRGPNQYECAHCHEMFLFQEMQADHIEPVIDPVVGYQDIYTYFNRLFCPLENWQALCRSCHKAKTSRENSERHKNKSWKFLKV